jgi:hypothetical protein
MKLLLRKKANEKMEPCSLCGEEIKGKKWKRLKKAREKNK